MSAALAIEDLAFTYPGEHHPVFDGLDITIEAGERVALPGPNGSGKTTLALHLNGLLRSAWRNRDQWTRLDDDTLADIRRRVSLVFQDPNDQLFMHRVRDDVASGQRTWGLTMWRSLVASSKPLMTSAPPGRQSRHRTTRAGASDAGQPWRRCNR